MKLPHLASLVTKKDSQDRDAPYEMSIASAAKGATTGVVFSLTTKLLTSSFVQAVVPLLNLYCLVFSPRSLGIS